MHCPRKTSTPRSTPRERAPPGRAARAPGPRPKPHPEPILHACPAAGSRPEQCLYVGDAERDIIAGRHAGMKTLVALFGYINSHETPERWGADGMIRAPGDILDWLKQDE